MIRYFCLVARGEAGDTAYAYLEALANVGRKLRAQPIGMAAFDCERRWWRAAHLFATSMTHTYVNVVCARPGLMLGTRMPVSALAATAVAKVPDGEGGTVVSDAQEPLSALERAIGGKIAPVDIVYQPETALVGLYTVGCTNVAITAPHPAPTQGELMALARYDRVITSSDGDRQAIITMLMELGLRHDRVVHVPPLADRIGALLDDLCGSATSASGVPSPASAAPRATTSPPSPPLGTRSRSSTGRRSLVLRAPPTEPRLPRVGTASSTGWWSRGPLAWMTARWRSITRSLGSLRGWWKKRRSPPDTNGGPPRR
jgi:hypothetical protein